MSTELQAETAHLSRKKIKVKKGEGLWLLSFCDLSMILISFFILMLSYSKPDKQKEDEVKSAVEQKFNTYREQNNLQDLQHKLETEVKKSGLQGNAAVQFDSDGLAVEFSNALIFSEGSAQANPKFEQAVGSVMKVIAGTPNKYRLVFEGHTDDQAVVGGEYRSNWELSSSRAITLLRYFHNKGVSADRMSVTAYADNRPKVEIAKLSGEALKAARAANRRVVIRIE